MLVDLFGTSVWNFVDTTIKALGKKDGVGYSDVVTTLTRKDSTRTLGDWVKPLIGKDLAILDASLYTINLNEFTSVMVDAQLGEYDSKKAYLKTIFDKIEVGHVVQTFMDDIQVGTDGVWAYTDSSKEMKLIISDLFGTNIWQSLHR